MDFQARTYQMGSALVYLAKAAAAHEISYSLAGRLQLSQTGWLVVSAPAALVRGAFDALHEHTTELPEEYSIPVMTPAELARIGGADKVVERGNSFHYTLGPVRASEPSSNTISKVWYICIFSQELKRLRRSYDLDPMMQGTGYFRLPIAVRKVVPRATKEAIDYLAEPDWNKIDYEAIKAAAQGYVYVEDDNGQRSSDRHVPGHREDPIKVPVPNVKQLSNHTCGPSVLAAVEGFFDKHVSNERQMRSAVAAEPEHGTTPKKIIEAARADGFNVEPQVLATLGQVKAYLDRDIPVIMAIQAHSSDKDVQDLEGGHYVTAIGYDDEGLIFQDPAIEGDDARGYLPYEDLDKRWIDKDTDGKIYPQLAIAIWKDKQPDQTSKARDRVKIALDNTIERIPHNKHVSKWLRLPSTPEIHEKKLKLDAEYQPQLLKMADSISAQSFNRLTESLTKWAGLAPDVQLQPHQQKLFEEAQEQPVRKILMHALGSGKTLSGISIAEAGRLPYTYVAPAALRDTMQKEINRFTDRRTPSNVLSYTQIARGDPVTNDSTLIFDEAHRLRNPSSMQTERAQQLADRARQVVMLTGTPIVNSPGDIAPLLSMAKGERISPEEFENRYIENQRVRPGLLARLRGVEEGEKQDIKNQEELKQLLKGHIDYYAPDSPLVPTKFEDHYVEMSPEQTQVYKAIFDELPWAMRWKIRNDFPLSRNEFMRLQSFFTGPRQVGLSTLPFMKDKDPHKAYTQSTKLQKAMELLQDRLKDPRAKALIFSNFIEAGLKPYAAALQKAGIPHGMFYGALNDRQRRQLVDGLQQQ